MSGFANISLALGVGTPPTPLPVAIVVGNNANVYRSLDLENWAAIPIGLAATWRGGAFAPDLGTQGRFVIFNNTGITKATAYSDDGGLTWNLVSDLPLSSSYQAITWDSINKKFCICGAPSGGVAQIYTSINGFTWVLSNTGARSDMGYNGCDFDDLHGTIVCIGNAGVVDHNGVITSADGGATWTVRTCNDGGWGHTTEVQFTGTSLVACGQSSLTYNRSVDGGITWTGGAGPFATAESLSGLPDDSLFVRVRNGGNAIDWANTFAGVYTNVNQGNIWTSARYDRLYGFNQFLGVSSTKAGYSANGKVWTNPAVWAFANPLDVVFGSIPP